MRKGRGPQRLCWCSRGKTTYATPRRDRVVGRGRGGVAHVGIRRGKKAAAEPRRHEKKKMWCLLSRNRRRKRAGAGAGGGVHTPHVKEEKIVASASSHQSYSTEERTAPREFGAKPREGVCCGKKWGSPLCGARKVCASGGRGTPYDDKQRGGGNH